MSTAGCLASVQNATDVCDLYDNSHYNNTLFCRKTVGDMPLTIRPECSQCTPQSPLGPNNNVSK